MKTTKIFAIILSLVMVMTILSMSASAARLEYLEYFNNQPNQAPSFNLNQETEFGAAQPNEDDIIDLGYQWKKFTIPSISIVSVKVRVNPQTNNNFSHNDLSILLFAPNASASISYRDALGNTASYIEVDSTGVILEKTANYRLLPGTYYLRGHSYWNGWGFVTVTAKAQPNDPGGEPNDTVMQAKPINIGTQYQGTLGYYGKLKGNEYDRDSEDHYKINVTQNNTAVKLTFGRDQPNAEISISAALEGQNVSLWGDRLSLQTSTSGTITWNITQSGTYILRIYGGWEPVNYSFKLDRVTPPSITVNRTKATIARGKSLQLKSTVKGIANRVTWSSSNTAVATVSANGKVTAKRAGTAWITATVQGGGNLSATTVVTVTQSVTGVKMNKKMSLSLRKKRIGFLKATVSPNNATDKRITWKSSNKRIATVNKSGTVTARRTGRVTITATTRNSKKVARCIVTVRK